MDNTRVTLNEYMNLIKNFDKSEEYFNIYKEACRIDIGTVWKERQKFIEENNEVVLEDAQGIFQKGVDTLKKWWDQIVKWFFGLWKLFPRFLKKFFTLFSTLAQSLRDYKSKTLELVSKVKEKFTGDSGVSDCWAEWEVAAKNKFKRSSGAFKYADKFEVNKKINMMITAQYSYQKAKEIPNAPEEDMVLKLANRCGEGILKLLHQGVDLFLEGEIPETGIQNQLDGKLSTEYKNSRDKGNSLLALLYNTEKLIDVPITVKMPNVLVELPKDFGELTRKMDDFFRKTNEGKATPSRPDRIEEFPVYKFLKEYRSKVNKEFTYSEYEFTKASFKQDEKELNEGIEKLKEMTEKVEQMKNSDTEIKSGQSTTQNMLDALNCMARTQSLFLDNISTLYQLILDSFTLRFEIIKSITRFVEGKSTEKK